MHQSLLREEGCQLLTAIVPHLRDEGSGLAGKWCTCAYMYIKPNGPEQGRNVPSRQARLKIDARLQVLQDHEGLLYLVGTIRAQQQQATKRDGAPGKPRAEQKCPTANETHQEGHATRPPCCLIRCEQDM